MHLVSAAEIERLYPVSGYDDPHADELGHVPYTPEFFAALGTMIARKLHARTNRYKVIALDCDETLWDGVANPVAVRHLKEMSRGARLVIYETGNHKSAVGTATVVSVDATDPRKPLVKIEAGKAIAKPKSLAEIKADKRFKDSPLVRIGRLSVVPLTKEQYQVLTGSG